MGSGRGHFGPERAAPTMHGMTTHTGHARFVEEYFLPTPRIAVGDGGMAGVILGGFAFVAAGGQERAVQHFGFILVSAAQLGAHDRR